MEITKVRDLKEKYNHAQKIVWKKHIKLFYYLLQTVHSDYTYDYFTALIYGRRVPNNAEEILLLALFEFIKNQLFTTPFTQAVSDLYFLLNKEAVTSNESKIINEIELLISEVVTTADLALIMVKLDILFSRSPYPYNNLALFLVVNRILVDFGINNIYVTLNQALILKNISNRNKEEKFTTLTRLLEDIFEKDRELPLSYLENLIPLTTEEIIEGIRTNQPFLQEDCFATALYLYGSFVKGSNRPESDIDLAIVFAEDITYSQKETARLKIKEKLFSVFHRFIDVNEVFASNDEQVAKKIGQNIKLY